MKKNLFEEGFIEKLNKNFNKRSKYFEFDFFVLSDLSKIVFEINKCIILEFYSASITLTNHLLERLLKLSLIYNETGIESIPAEKWSEVFEEPNKKYCSIPLGNSIEKCRKLELITKNEKVFLFDKIRDLMRNGFSHADYAKILDDLPNETTMFLGSFSNPTELKPVYMNPKIIPSMQTIHIENFAKENATNYFDYVFELIKKIDQRLVERNKKTSI